MSGEFSWLNVVPTLVGGGISLGTTVAMFIVAQRHDKKKREHESRKRLALSAFDGLRKLLEVSNGLENIKLHIDEAFKSADESGGSHLDPYAKVMPFVGVRITYKDLVADELFFLTKIKGSELISEIDLIIRRARNDEVVIEKYSEMRQEINTLLETRVSSDTLIEGTRISVDINASDKVILDMRGGLLNNILGTLMQHLDVDCATARDVCARYLKAAQSEYHDDFPKVKLEWMR